MSIPVTPLRFSWRDSTTWKPLFASLEGQRRTKHRLFKVIKETYESVVAFHGTRTADVEKFYRNGLQIADHRKLNERAREIFLSKEFPEIDESTFCSVTEKISESDNHLLHLGLDDRTLLDDAGHYLIYGSEHIIGIGASLTRHFGGAKDYRQVLKRFGQPTMLRLSLPLSMIADWNLLALAEVVRDAMKMADAGQQAPKADFTFILKASLPRECVLGHDHPRVIKDPLLPMQPLYHFPAR